MVRAAVFTDNDFDKINGVTTTLKAVLRHAADDVMVRVYTAAGTRADRPDYCAVRSVGIGLPYYREMRIYWPRMRELERRVVADGADVMHITTPGPIGLAARVLAARLELPVTGSFHTNLGTYVTTFSGFTRLGRVMDRYMRWLYERCDPVLVPSAATRDELIRNGYRAGRVRLWSRGVDSDRFSPERRSETLRCAWGVEEGRPAILYAGRLSREKGLELLPAIQRTLESRGRPHRLVLVGDGPMAAELRQTCPGAVFLGVQPHDQVAVAMASADVFLFPSATDTLGNVVLEAQASGLPVVVSDRGGPREQMRNGSTGWMVPAGDSAAFAGRLEAILGSADVQGRMSLEARAFASTRSWPASLAPLMDAWRVAARRREPAVRLPGGSGIGVTSGDAPCSH